MAGISSAVCFSKSCKREGEDTPAVDKEVYKFILEVKMRRDYVHGLIICGKIQHDYHQWKGVWQPAAKLD